MANTFKKVLDRQMWVQVAPSGAAHNAGISLTSDLRSDVSRTPFVYQLASSNALIRFNIITKAWGPMPDPLLSNAGFGAGAGITFAPSFGAVGVIAAGATTTRVTLSTALPTAVGVNMLGNRGGSGDYGYKLRIIDPVAGKTAERFIVGNTAGTTPTIDVLSSWGFTPSTGAKYELLSGRIFMIVPGTAAANSWKSFEIATNTLSGSLSIVNLQGSISNDSQFLVLDELYTPFDCKPGEGMIKGTYAYDSGLSTLNALTATGSAAGTLTGQATLGDSVVAANEYRNFQIRIVEDTVTPAAVGQRRIIASHTAGVSPVYTLGTNWTTTPSTSAKYVIEQPNLILLRTSLSQSVFVWNYSDATINNGTNSIASNAWSNTYFSQCPTAAGAGGAWIPSFGIQPDAGRNARHSFQYFFRGGNNPTLDLLDIAGSITGTWTGSITYNGISPNLNTGSCSAPAPWGNEGRFTYINAYINNAVNQIYRFDAKHRILSPHTPTDFLQSGTAAVGNRMATYAAIDGNDLYDVVFLLSHLSSVAQELIVLV